MNVLQTEFSELKTEFSVCRAGKKEQLSNVESRMTGYEETQIRLFKNQERIGNRISWMLGGLAAMTFLIPFIVVLALRKFGG